jgi:hypothetical protein
MSNNTVARAALLLIVAGVALVVPALNQLVPASSA